MASVCGVQDQAQILLLYGLESNVYSSLLWKLHMPQNCTDLETTDRIPRESILAHFRDIPTFFYAADATK
jgi:hypothetical protein